MQVLVGEKYGYRPLPTVIPAGELEMLCAIVAGEQEPEGGAERSQLLQQWYKKDANSIEPIYVLQSISSIITNFKNKVTTSRKLRKNFPRGSSAHNLLSKQPHHVTIACW